MRLEDATRVCGVEREENGNRSGRGDDDVVPAHASTLTGLEDARHVGGVTGVPTPAQPPARPAVA